MMSAVGGAVIVAAVGGAVIVSAVGGAVIVAAVGGAVIMAAVGGAVIMAAVGVAVIMAAVGGAVIMAAVGGAVSGNNQIFHQSTESNFHGIPHASLRNSFGITCKWLPQSPGKTAELQQHKNSENPLSRDEMSPIARKETKKKERKKEVNFF
jgi:hypothetical protein